MKHGKRNINGLSNRNITIEIKAIYKFCEKCDHKPIVVNDEYKSRVLELKINMVWIKKDIHFFLLYLSVYRIIYHETCNHPWFLKKLTRDLMEGVDIGYKHGYSEHFYDLEHWAWSVEKIMTILVEMTSQPPHHWPQSVEKFMMSGKINSRRCLQDCKCKWFMVPFNIKSLLFII